MPIRSTLESCGVASVLSRCEFSKVAGLVVERVSVYVVNAPLRPRSSQPSMYGSAVTTMKAVFLPGDYQRSCAVTLRGLGALALHFLTGAS